MLVSLLVTLLGLGLVGTTGPHADAAESDQLSVTIDTLSPTALRSGGSVTVTGRISNPTERTWSRVRVYLALPSEPLTTTRSVDSVLADPTTVGGLRRVTALDSIGTAGDLSPGDTTTFRLEVPFGRLGISGASGVYPVSVQVLATAPNGTRSDDAVGRALTVLPYVADDAVDQPARVSVVWPFVDPVQRDADGLPADADALVQAVSPGGRLDRLLALARADESAPATVLVDPALLDALRDIALDSYGPSRAGGPGGAAAYDPDQPVEEETDTQRVARSFLSDLVTYARRHTVWTLPYGRPDAAALGRPAAAESGQAVTQAAVRATEATVSQFGLRVARTVSWPPNGITNRRRLDRSRALGADAALLSPDVLRGWSPADSDALQVEVDGLPMDAVVLDPGLQPVTTGAGATLALRQRLASRAALSALSPTHPGVVLVADPAFDPGNEWERADFSSVFDPAWVRPVGTDAQLGDAAQVWEGRVRLPGKSKQRPISNDQVEASAEILTGGSALDEMLGASTSRSVFFDQSAALAASQGWRQARTRGLEHAQSQADAVSSILDEVTVSVTSFVTLSGSSGRFPVTITNGLDVPVTVGVRFFSESPSTRIPDVEVTEISPGQSLTTTVTAEAGQATTSAVTASLVTAEGTIVGVPAPFTVRSSVVGRVVWVFLALAVLLVVVAVARRVVRARRRRRVASPEGR
ncbi:UNVERIFIED_CONTAM: hypothetical protein LK11_46180 [Mumia flava]